MKFYIWRAAPRSLGMRPTEASRGPRRVPRPARHAPPRPPIAAADPARAWTAQLAVRPTEPPEHVFRRLLGAYLAGAREFVVRERPVVRSDTRDVIRSFCRRTRQPEIVSEDRGVVRLRDLAFENPVPLPQRIARMGRLVVEFHRDAVDSWSRLPFGEDGAWERRDDEIDREAWYIQRLATLAPDPATTPVLGPFMIARSLERIADHAVVLGESGRRLVDLPQSVGPITSLKQFHGQAMHHLEGVLGATDGAGANDLLDTGEALMASGRALADRLLPAVEGGTMPPATAAAIGRILESIGRTIAYSEDIAQVVLDRSLPLAAPEPRGTARRVLAAA